MLRKLRVHWEASCGTALDSFTRLYFYIMVPDRETCSTLLVLHGGAQTFGDVPLRPGYALFWPGRTAEKVAESARACRP